MDVDNSRPHRVNRRTFLGSMSSAAAGAVVGVTASRSVSGGPAYAGQPPGNDIEPFYGVHQGGIATEPQSHSMFVAFDVTTDHREDLTELLRMWTNLAAELSLGRSGPSFSDVAGGASQDSGSTVGLGPARLTVNVGFGPGLFGLGDSDRFGLSADRPVALIDLPEFPGDQLTEVTTGGDLSLHACADDPQVVFHAAQQLVRAAHGVAVARWSQVGFNEAGAAAGTPRNLMGFKDGTTNPSTELALDELVWVSGAGPDWMVGGTYLVARRIRIDFDAWDDTPVGVQERIIGRHKLSGAPLGRSAEFDTLDLAAKDSSGESCRASRRSCADCLTSRELEQRHATEELRVQRRSCRIRQTVGADICSDRRRPLVHGLPEQSAPFLHPRLRRACQERCPPAVYDPYGEHHRCHSPRGTEPGTLDRRATVHRLAGV